jgi:hypothetical protein
MNAPHRRLRTLTLLLVALVVTGACCAGLAGGTAQAQPIKPPPPVDGGHHPPEGVKLHPHPRPPRAAAQVTLAARADQSRDAWDEDSDSYR